MCAARLTTTLGNARTRPNNVRVILRVNFLPDLPNPPEHARTPPIRVSGKKSPARLKAADIFPMMRVKASCQFGCFEGLTFDHPNSPEQCSGDSSDAQGRGVVKE